MPERGVLVRFMAPSAGMNTRDGIALLQPQEARFLENWTPIGTVVAGRLGKKPYSTEGAASAVKTLAAYNGTSSQKLIGVSSGSIYDYTADPAVLVFAGGYSNSRFQTECYVNRLFGVNGVDTPWVYNGTSIAATGFSGSGLMLEDLVNIKKVRNRLWFCENDSADAWYGGLGSITGTLTKFQISQVAGGGTLVAIAAHSQDGGDGPDDMTAFIMSTGEVILYSGDPSTTFAKIGNYTMPAPIGRQCTVNIGGQLAVVTHAGLIPVAAALAGTAFDIVQLGNFGKVAPSIKADADDYADNEGWQALTSHSYVIINVPTSDTTSRQWVYNTHNGAWTRWTHMASALCTFETELFFGDPSDGTVYRAEGADDDGEEITYRSRGSFVSTPEAKRMEAQAIRFDIALDGELSGAFGIDTDYQSRFIVTPSVDIATSDPTTPWGSDWGSPWSVSSQYEGQWFSTYGEGRALALALDASGIAAGLQWFGGQIMVQGGGAL